MKILVVNDDGIQARGIEFLTLAAARLGEVWVVAPDSQCSAMSHRITLDRTLKLTPVTDYLAGKEPTPYPVHAYALDGTPADCVRVALGCLLPEKPDVVLSGINRGYNGGVEVVYSGTVSAAMEGVLQGIPAIAFSVDMQEQYDVVEKYLPELLPELIATPAGAGTIWNVNFPSCSKEECAGILRNRKLARVQFYQDVYQTEETADGVMQVLLHGKERTEAEDGTDLDALLHRYVSVGKITNMVWSDVKS